MLIALLVTLACLPLLVLEVVGGSVPSDAAGTGTSSDSSLVVATQESVIDAVVDGSVDPSSVEIDTPSTTEPVAVAAAVATAPPTIARAPQAAPTTTTTVAAPPPPIGQSDAEFLACVRMRESHGDYSASDPTGAYLGAYQIYQGGWDAIAASIGRSDLVGVPPNMASPADQDAVAAAMLARHGRAPWGGTCR